MLRIPPHRQPVLSFVPRNDLAKAVVRHPRNRHRLNHVHVLSDNTYLDALDAGFFIPSRRIDTLVTLGRAGDIVFQDGRISEIQCSIEINRSSGQYVLYDRSTARSTHVFGKDAQDFSRDQTVRKVLVTPDLNTNIWISTDNSGAGKGEGFHFELLWHDRAPDAKAMVESFPEDPLHQRTIETTPDRAPLPPDTLPDTRPKMRFHGSWGRGRGSSGLVEKTVDIDTGNVYAVKTVLSPAQMCAELRAAKLLTDLDHPNIIKVHYAQWNHEKGLHVIMDVHEGCLNVLVDQGVFDGGGRPLNDLLHQMLKAKNELDCKGLVHGDFKPSNICYSPKPSGGYLYVLIDFGNSHSNDEAAISVGTEPFIAPELRRDPGTRQTSKADIWSLAVTILYVANAANFRERNLQTEEGIMEAINSALQDPQFAHLRPMLEVDPAKRATAADMLRDGNYFFPYLDLPRRPAHRACSLEDLTRSAALKTPQRPVPRVRSLEDLSQCASPGSHDPPRRPVFLSLEDPKPPTMTSHTDIAEGLYLPRTGDSDGSPRRPVSRSREDLDTLECLERPSRPARGRFLGSPDELAFAGSKGSSKGTAPKAGPAPSRKRPASSGGDGLSATRRRRRG